MENIIYGAYSRLKIGGGGIYLPVNYKDRREQRNYVNAIGNDIIYDSDRPYVFGPLNPERVLETLVNLKDTEVLAYYGVDYRWSFDGVDVYGLIRNPDEYLEVYDPLHAKVVTSITLQKIFYSIKKDDRA